jgi:hypothetical protein
MLEKKRKYNGTVPQIFADYEKGHDSVRREVLYNILSVCGTPMKLVNFNQAPCHEGVLGSGGIAPHILDLDTRWR